MKILVLSDSHGAVSPMEQAVERTDPHLILHLGDCWRDGEKLQNRFPTIPHHFRVEYLHHSFIQP